MTVALLVSMVVGFWMSETDLVPQDAARNLKQVVEKIQNFELTRSCYLSFEKFSTVRMEGASTAPTSGPGGTQAN